MEAGKSWADDLERMKAVGRYLGVRALHHARDRPSIGVESARKASAEIEVGCRMQGASRVP